MGAYLLAMTCQAGFFLSSGVASGWLTKALGLSSLAGGAVVGTGAYAYAIAARAGLEPSGCVAVAALAGCCVGAVLAVTRGRVEGSDFALATYCGQMVWLGVVANASALTGGALGLSAIPGIELAGLARSGVAVVLLGALCTLAALVCHVGERGWFWTGAAVVRRSAELADTLGVDRLRIELQVGAIYGGTLALSGAVMASYLSFVGVSSFDASVSIAILALGYLGAAGGLGGTAAATLLVVVFPEFVRLAGMSSARSGYLRLLLSGVVVAAYAMWRHVSHREMAQR